MPSIRLRQIPDRTPIKLSVMVSPELHQELLDYAGLYQESYGKAEPLSELVPAMLAAFLDADRSFAQHQKRNGR